MIPPPFFSVIIPTYNSAKFIEESINSVLQQDFSDYEIIVINDGSTDNTKEILMNFGSRIRYINQINRGVSYARNIGIDNSNGKYITFLDSDDKWAKNKLSIQKREIAARGAGWIYSDSYIIDEKRILRKTIGQSIKLHEGFVFNQLIIRDFIPFLTIAVKKNILNEIGYFNENLTIGEDWDLKLRIAYKYPIQLINQPLAFYNLHEANSGYNVNFEKRISNLSSILDYFHTKNIITSHIYRSAKSHIYLSTSEILLRNGNFDQAKRVLESGGTPNFKIRLYKILLNFPKILGMLLSIRQKIK